MLRLYLQDDLKSLHFKTKTCILCTALKKIMSCLLHKINAKKLKYNNVTILIDAFLEIMILVTVTFAELLTWKQSLVSQYLVRSGAALNLPAGMQLCKK